MFQMFAIEILFLLIFVFIFWNFFELVWMHLQRNGQQINFLRTYSGLCKGTLLFSLVSLIVPMIDGQLSSMVPMNGPLSGGTIFTVFGAFTTNCATKLISFNTLQATSVVYGSSNVTGIVPAYISGLASATLSYSGSGSCTSQSFSSSSLFSYDSFIFNDILFSSKETAGGGSITVFGKNFLASTVKIGSTSSGCVTVTNFISFKCAIPALSLGARDGLNVTVTMNGVQTTLFKFAYDPPVLSKIVPQLPQQDGVTPITVFGNNLEAFAPTTVIIGALSCSNIYMITPHQEFSCLPSASNELVRTTQLVRVSLYSGANIETSWNFEPTNTFLNSVPQGAPRYESANY
jgi:hypothetical protein